MNEDNGSPIGGLANLTGAYLVGANLRYTDLTGADLIGANLVGANLRYTNLTGADLTGANLAGADLTKANLRYTSLTGADLVGANLTGANLTKANLTDADLTGADLTGANLTKANLTGANLTNAVLPDFSIVPEEGSFIGWKKVTNGILKLEIPSEAKRTSSLVGRKCRAEFVRVLEYIGEGKAISQYDQDFEYVVGELVYPDSYNDDIRVECTSGIHFFITRKEAENY